MCAPVRKDLEPNVTFSDESNGNRVFRKGALEKKMTEVCPDKSSNIDQYLESNASPSAHTINSSSKNYSDDFSVAHSSSRRSKKDAITLQTTPLSSSGSKTKSSISNEELKKSFKEKLEVGPILIHYALGFWFSGI